MAAIVYQSKLERFNDLVSGLEKGTPLRSRLQSIKETEGMDLTSVIDDLTDALLKCRVFALSNDPANRKGFYFLSFVPKLMFLFSINRQWKSIKAKLKNIKEKPTSSRGEILPRPKVYGSLESSWALDPSNIIGFNDAVEKLIKILRENDDRFTAIAILGMGGSGKTVLAQKLYNSFRDDEFEVRIWVSMSKHLYKSNNHKSIILSILHQLQENPDPMDEVKMLLESLREQLRGKRYLIVLDGVHHVEEWLENLSDNDNIGAGEITSNKLSHGLPINSLGGAVVVTTREEEAAKKMVGENIYVMERLDDDKCWKIFQNSFGDLDDRHVVDTLGRMKKDICYDCQGLPLVAKSLGTVIRRSELATHRWD